MASGIPGIPLALIGVGGVLVYSGIENQSLTSILHSLASGKKPVPGQPETYATPAGGTTAAQPDSTTLSGPNSDIASDAQKYTGAPYVWGGFLPTGWDCSGFVNYVLGHDFGLTLPGGFTWTGESHGPVVAQYQLWTGAEHIPASQVAAGDLVLFTAVHMGIAVSNTEFISAEDPANGTGIAPISAGPGPANFVRVRK